TPRVGVGQSGALHVDRRAVVVEEGFQLGALVAVQRQVFTVQWNVTTSGALTSITVTGRDSREPATFAFWSFPVASPQMIWRPPRRSSRMRVGASATTDTSGARRSGVSAARTVSAARVDGSSGPGDARRSCGRSGAAGRVRNTTPDASSTAYRPS